ncbi:hypothetical protein H8B13_20800 [Hymenobacter sp. BT188]|uniref:hypothetical protein n=1 Tax=Hymenobacter sp. BT188 TaxID=2763504 RepID=UPI0016512C4A|nr:hypothetical protein [Hymenobacter sp. BT188]MBC6609271.1 hypothetical protein [Hymenobacter sp. BT188]
MQRLLSHLLLLLYAGVYLHCQPMPVGAGSAAASGGTRQEVPRSATCKKKLQTVQADTKVEKQQLAQAKLLPLDAALGSDFMALYFGLLFPAHQPALNPTRGPTAGPALALANHPNKAPPVRFS